MRRHFWTTLFVLVFLLAIGTHNVKASSGNCQYTSCSFYCTVFGQFAGYCNGPAEPTTGCIQLYGPDCASMDGAACCRTGGNGAF